MEELLQQILRECRPYTGQGALASYIPELARQDPDRLVVVDEAYVDFGGESAACLLGRYDNLLVVGTFSKSRSLAGARLGYAVGSPALNSASTPIISTA